MTLQNPSLQSLLSPLLAHPSTKSWLFPNTEPSPLSPTTFSKGLPISVQQETLSAESTPLASGTNIEQLIVASHQVQHLLYGYVYATGAKYSEAQRERRRRQSTPQILKARFCYDSHNREFVVVQASAPGQKIRGVMSFQRLHTGHFKKNFFLVEDTEGEGVGSCIAARCVVGESDDNCIRDGAESGFSLGDNAALDLRIQQFEPSTHSSNFPSTTLIELPSLTASVAHLQRTVTGSFFSLSSTEHLLSGTTVAKRDVGRELTIVGNVDMMMVEDLQRRAASLHYSDSLSPRVEEKLDLEVRRRLAAWRSLQRRRLRDIGEKWELKALKELKVVLERRYKVVRAEGELLRALLES